MTYAVAYLAILLPFGLLDAVWLSLMGPRLYKPTLGDILLANVNVPAAIAFYLIYPIGILIFATLPALKAGSVAPALIYAALFGALAYGTYDLTNQATLRNWTLQLTLADMAWGTIASGLAGAASYYLTRTISDWLGIA
ncbi:DUF2177 family protein [Undibacter mobilis]|uniref:DUF2177 family protein n=1 Tax=Undibacter mobilis TaxID=2292256 RepID=A0A371B7M6_9BRAD|nr:DUF2177 family protein [Undibacter mobilis]RDV03588.1 DUF2177 family protein [Undibacter mobilis]